MAPDLRLHAVQQFGVVTAEQAARCGYNPREIEELCAKGAWTRLRSGIYLPDKAPDRDADPRGRHLVDAAAALLAIRADDAVLAHTTADVAWQLVWLTAPDLGRVTLARPTGASSRRYPGLHVRPAPLPAHHLRTAPNGMPACDPARTIVDLARRLGFREALVMADAALNLRIVTRSELDRVLADCSGWPGVREAARHLAHADGRSESPAESLARAVIIELGLPTPDLQVRILAPDGRFVGRVDLIYRAGRVIIEVDGLGKYRRPEDVQKEKLREDALRRLGFEVVRLTWADLQGPADLVRRRITEALARAARRVA